jgi:hypothetical protein
VAIRIRPDPTRFWQIARNGPARTPGSPDTTARTPKVFADCG